MLHAIFIDGQWAAPRAGAVLALAAWWHGRAAVRGTTLREPWTWRLLAALTVCGGAAARLASNGQPGWEHPLSFALAVTLFCPTISLLGARRPHHLAWQLIVVTLWCILALPALELALLGRGEVLAIRDFRGWFLWLLIGGELVNRLGTRLWWVGCGSAGLAMLLLSEHLPLLRQPVDDRAWLLAAVGSPLLMLAMARRFRAVAPRTLHPLDQAWLDFRDRFGTLWSLRVMERLNSLADTQDWPLRLGWTGWRSAVHRTDHRAGHAPRIEQDTAIPASLRQALVNLLRRFESDERLRALASESPAGEDAPA
jgi:hypothetical protein